MKISRISIVLDEFAIGHVIARGECFWTLSFKRCFQKCAPRITLGSIVCGSEEWASGEMPTEMRNLLDKKVNFFLASCDCDEDNLTSKWGKTVLLANVPEDPRNRVQKRSTISQVGTAARLLTFCALARKFPVTDEWKWAVKSRLENGGERYKVKTSHHCIGKANGKSVFQNIESMSIWIYKCYISH